LGGKALTKKAKNLRKGKALGGRKVDYFFLPFKKKLSLLGGGTSLGAKRNYFFKKEDF